MHLPKALSSFGSQGAVAALAAGAVGASMRQSRGAGSQVVEGFRALNPKP